MKIFSIRQFLKAIVLASFFGVAFFTNSGLFKVPNATAATSDLSGHAWSEKIGWISFSGNAGDGSPYSVKVDTTNKDIGSTGDFSGHAWSSNVGWISFNRAETGNPPSAPFNSGSGPIAQINWTGGKATGWARTINGMNTGGWDGWIKLSDDSVSVWQNKGVIFSNPSFTSAFSGYAWEPDTIGWIDFGPTVVDPTTGSPVFVGVKLGGVSAGDAPIVVADVTVGGISATQVASGALFTLMMSSLNSPTSCAWSRVSDKTADDFTSVSLGVGITSYSSTNSWAGPLSVTWTFTCTNTYGSGTDSVTFTIGSPTNTLPVANAGVDQTIVLPTSSATLTGTAATDSNGTITGTVWTKVSGPAGGSITNPNTLSTGITGLTTAGTYVFRLTATDNDGATGFDDVQITVSATGITGSLSLAPTSCIIAVDASTCSTVRATWNTSGATSPALVDVNTGDILNTSANKTSFQVWVAYPQTVLNVQDGATVLSTQTATASCATGSGWDDASQTCKLGVITPTGSLSLAPTSCVITAGASTCSTVYATWNTSDATDPALWEGNTNTKIYPLANGTSLQVWVAYPQTVLNVQDGATVLSTQTATASCATGSGWDDASQTCKLGVITPTGSLSLAPTSCVITAGASTCSTVYATWNTSDATDPALWEGNTNTKIYPLANGTSLQVWVAYPQTVFNLQDDTTVLATQTATASCEANTTWNGTICAGNLDAPTGAVFGPTQGVPGTYTFTVTAIDPQSDAIRYGIDWNMDGTADEWLPSDLPVVQYVGSGTPQDFTHTWTTNGTQAFQVIVQDTAGNSSWIQYNIVISDIAPTVPIYIAPVAQNITSGTETVIIWNVDPTVYTTSTCLASDTNGGSWSVDSASYFNPTGVLPDGTTTYTITCTNNTDSTVVVTNSTTVTVTPVTAGSTCNYDKTCDIGETIATCPNDCLSLKEN